MSKPWKPGNRVKDGPLPDIKLILNKITEEKFLPLSLEIRSVFEEKVHSENDMKDCAIAILNKSIKEKNYSALYVDLCKYLTHIRPCFKRIILENSQRMFEKCISNDKPLKGHCILVAELYNADLLTNTILFAQVIQRLLKKADDNSIEGLCPLLERVWKRTLIYGKKQQKATRYLEHTLKHFRELYQQKDSAISTRVRFIMMDILEKEIST